MTNSAELWARARASIPGGVNSPVRSFAGVGGDPFFVTGGDGAWIHTADGQRMIDYVQSWGASILGHAHPAIVDAVTKAARSGTSFGIPTEAEVLLAEEIRAAVPSVEKVRLVSSGTEATMSAIRLARGFTGRDTIIKFDGNYHGHADMLLVAAGSGVATLGIPGSAGVPAASVAHTAVARYNDLDSVAAVFAAHPDSVAAVIAEPVAANIGCVPPVDGFLVGLADLCRAHGALFILDEVMTGFRMARGGAQAVYRLTPDLSCFGKVIGGGLPVGAFGGRADVMDQLAPSGPVYQAGTLSGNPLATAAGLAALRLMKDGAYTGLVGRATDLAARLDEVARTASIPMQVQRAESLLGVYFASAPVRNYDDAKASDTAMYKRFFHALLRRGVYLPPSPFEAFFVSMAHGWDELERTTDAAGAALAEALQAGPSF